MGYCRSPGDEKRKMQQNRVILFRLGITMELEVELEKARNEILREIDKALS